MVARWHNFYATCPDFDGSQPNYIPAEQQLAAHLQNLTRGRADPVVQTFRPGGCRFVRADNPDMTPVEQIQGTIELAQRNVLAADYFCPVHHRTPILWARHAAYSRRVRPLIDAAWTHRVEPIAYTDARGMRRTTNVTVWIPQRPAPRTMHTAWQALTG